MTTLVATETLVEATSPRDGVDMDSKKRKLEEESKNECTQISEETSLNVKNQVTQLSEETSLDQKNQISEETSLNVKKEEPVITTSKRRKIPTPRAAAAAAAKLELESAPKSRPKSKPKAKIPKTLPDGTVKKRKIRTLDDKKLENASMETSFYTENGSEWHGTNVDFDDLAQLRQMYELPAACHILWLLQQPLTLRCSNTLLEYERALLEPETSTMLEDIFTKLLLKKSERDCLAPGIGLKYEWWNKQLREYYIGMYEQWYRLLRKAGDKNVPTGMTLLLGSPSDDEEEETVEEKQVELKDDEWLALDILTSRLQGLGLECPFAHCDFHHLSITLRCRVLLNLCQAVIDDPANTDFIRQMEDDDLRIEPVGRDRCGNWYYFFPQFYEERRMYRLEMNTKEWHLWAKGDDAFIAMLQGMKQIKGRRGKGEQELIDHLEVIIETIQEEAEVRAKQLDKLTKKAILEAIPRKRSMRLQVKQIEESEKQHEVKKKSLSLEELAELKRNQLLRKVEQEAEREQRERERNQRKLEQEIKEREAAIAERETRRLKRLEKEQMEQIEQDQQKQERELRAIQRNPDQQLSLAIANSLSTT